jgi:hypothetical protein
MIVYLTYQRIADYDITIHKMFMNEAKAIAWVNEDLDGDGPDPTRAYAAMEVE